jgi:hypothetical protein
MFPPSVILSHILHLLWQQEYAIVADVDYYVMILF